MADIRLAKPAAGTSQNVVCTPEARFVFEFPTDEATLSRNGDNLVITFEDGSTLQLENFYTAYSSENMPSFSVDGAEISGEDFFTAMNEPDLMPAAGPAGNAGNQSNGNRFHDYVNADLLDGLDRLGGLDIGWPGSDVNPETDGAATSGDYVDIDYGVTVTPGDPGSIDDTPVIDNPDNPNDNPPAGVVADRDVLRVQESNLAGGTNPNADALSADGFMNIDAPDGVASITIGSVTVFESGALTGTRVFTDEGYLEVTGFDPATGRLDYTYHLTGSTQEHEKDTAADDSIAHELPVTVTDTDGSTGSGVITVVISDDGPVLSDVTAEATQIADTQSTISLDFAGLSIGADTEGATLTVEVNGTTFTGTQDNEGKWGFTSTNAKTGESLAMGPDGKFIYTRPEGDTAGETSNSYTFNVTVTDADRDSVSDSVTVTTAVKPGFAGQTPEGSIDNMVTDDSGLTGGNTFDPDGSGATSSVQDTGSFSVTLNGREYTITLTGKEGSTLTLQLDADGNLKNPASLDGVTIEGNYGTLSNISVSGGTISYTYTQTDNYHHASDDNDSDAAAGGADSFGVSVSDGLNEDVTGRIDVTIEDDGPVLSDVTAEATQIADTQSTISLDFAGLSIGADTEGATLTVEVNGTTFTGTQDNEGKWGFTSTNAKTGESLAMGPDGKFIYTRPEGDTAGETSNSYTFNVTVTDADRDSVSDSVTVTTAVKPGFAGQTPEGSIDNMVTDDSGLTGGNTFDPDGSGATSSVQDTGSFSVTLNGREYTITLTGKEGSTLTLQLDADGNLKNPASLDGVTIEGNYGTLSNISVSGGTISYTYTQTDNYHHASDDNDSDAAAGGADSFGVSVSDGLNDAATGTIDVTIEDDGPVINIEKPITSMKPGSSDLGNLDPVDEVISFINYKQEGVDENGKPIYVQVTDEMSTTYWNEQITISATKVTYSGLDEWGNQFISAENSENMKLDYSLYNGGAKQYYNGTPPKEDIDNNIAHKDKNGWYRNAPESDWGLTVNGGEGEGEIQASDDDTSEAVVINLKGYAYGMTINFGAFFAGKSNPDDPAAGTGYDTVSEKALIAFYKDGQLVYSTVVEGTNSGDFTFNTGDVVLEGFDKVVISAVDNGENSDFTIQGFDFITKRDDPIIVSSGTVTAESGADGFADAYEDSHVGFDLESMVGGELNKDGTGTITVFIEGEKTQVTLSVSTGSSGNFILTGTLSDGEQLFTATLDSEGNWSMEQYEEFRVANDDGGPSDQFELVFKTEDADGDIADISVTVPLDITDVENNDEGIAIGNGDDTITITGGDGVAGTIAAGDTGGASVNEVVQPGETYNISIMLDLSGSMKDPLHSLTKTTRIEMAVNALKNFFKTSLQNHDGDISLQLVGFGTGEIGTRTWTIDGDATAAEKQQVYRAFASQLDRWRNAMDRGGYSQGTNYESAMKEATQWFNEHAGNGGENLAFFISDGQPTYYNYNGTHRWGDPDVDGKGSYSDQNTVEATLEAAQNLQQAGGGVQVNAIGIGTNTSLPEKAQTILDLIDNTGGSGQNVASYPYQTSDNNWAWTEANWKGDQPLTEGKSDLVNSEDDLTAALQGGSSGLYVDLDDAGNDRIDASSSDSSAIIYGDAVNTDMLQAALVAAGIKIPEELQFGSGSEIFKWLEDSDNASVLAGTEFEGWTHDDSVKYMMEHHEELGYETVMKTSNDGTTDFFLVDLDGNVLEMDGTETGTVLDDRSDLTGRADGHDTITGSKAGDIIFGQEGNDTIRGGEGADTIYGGTGNDLLYGDGGDDFLFGGAGDDYLDGGEGRDTMYAGSGDDIVVYDSSDYLIDGGDGIDVLLVDDTELGGRNIEELLGDGHSKEGDKTLVNGFEVVITGENASDLGLTSMSDLGITVTDNAVTLDGHWQEAGAGRYKGTFENASGENITLTMHVDTSIQDMVDQAAQNIANSNG